MRMNLAAHDAFTGERALHFQTRFLSFTTKTQFYSLANLAAMGVKMLDVRFAYFEKPHGKYLCCHGLGMYDADIPYVFELANRFDVKLRIGHEDVLLNDGVPFSQFVDDMLKYARYYNVYENITYIWSKGGKGDRFIINKMDECAFPHMSECYLGDEKMKAELMQWIAKTPTGSNNMNYCSLDGGLKLPYFTHCLPLPAMWCKDIREAVYKVAANSNATYMLNYIK